MSVVIKNKKINIPGSIISFFKVKNYSNTVKIGKKYVTFHHTRFMIEIYDLMLKNLSKTKLTKLLQKFTILFAISKLNIKLHIWNLLLKKINISDHKNRYSWQNGSNYTRQLIELIFTINNKQINTHLFSSATSFDVP